MNNAYLSGPFLVNFDFQSSILINIDKIQNQYWYIENQYWSNLYTILINIDTKFHQYWSILYQYCCRFECICFSIWVHLIHFECIWFFLVHLSAFVFHFECIWFFFSAFVLILSAFDFSITNLINIDLFWFNFECICFNIGKICFFDSKFDQYWFYFELILNDFVSFWWIMSAFVINIECICSKFFR